MKLPRNIGAFSTLAGWVAGSLVAVILVAGCRSSDTRGRGGAGRPDSPGGLPVPPEAWQREADRWVGTPYQRGGDDRSGADCSGFVCQVYRRVARVDLPRTTRDQFLAGFEVGRSDLRPGDLVFFDTQGKGVAHVGLMVGGDRFAHASSSKGVMYSRLSETYWSGRYRGARRLPRGKGRRRSGVVGGRGDGIPGGLGAPKGQIL